MLIRLVYIKSKMSRADKKLYYMCAVREKVIIADFTHSEFSRAKANYQQFTNDVLSHLTRGTFVLPYKEYSECEAGWSTWS